jgi:hypothetical protein
MEGRRQQARVNSIDTEAGIAYGYYLSRPDVEYSWPVDEISWIVLSTF